MYVAFKKKLLWNVAKWSFRYLWHQLLEKYSCQPDWKSPFQCTFVETLYSQLFIIKIWWKCKTLYMDLIFSVNQNHIKKIYVVMITQVRNVSIYHTFQRNKLCLWFIFTKKSCSKIFGSMVTGSCTCYINSGGFQPELSNILGYLWLHSKFFAQERNYINNDTWLKASISIWLFENYSW